ncbi:MAG: hypothetical protein ACRDIX_02655, partial [Actinomycetota bacterium]
ARKTAESLRKDMLAKAEDEARQVVARAQGEIQAERDRTFEELRGHVGELTIELASRVIGQSLDRRRQAKLVDEYIDELARSGNGHRKGERPRDEGNGNRNRREAAAKRPAAKGTSRRKAAPAKGASRKSSSAKTSTAKRTARKRKS